MLVVSAFTPDYAEHANRLIASLDRFNQPRWIESMPETGVWERNCAQKGAFMLRAMEATGGNILWLDADAELRGPLPSFLDTDFAVVRFPQAQPKLRFRSGTVYFGATEDAKRLVSAWAVQCVRNPMVWDQESLVYAWDDWDGTTRWLPEKWCHRFCDPGADKALILQHQASRKLKKKAHLAKA